jgi:DNA polymerase theta
VAKKIKSGARKIVLDKAEEARIVAFSAFKSLGFDVPHFSQPILSTAIGDRVRQGAATISFGDGTSSSFVDVEHVKPVSANPSIYENESSDKVALESGGEKFMRTPNIALVAPAKVNSTTAMYCNSSAVSSVVPVEGSVTNSVELNAIVANAKSTDMTCAIQLQRPGDGIVYLDRGVQEPHNRQNLCVGNKESACAKGPINAINTPGGFDSFLDLWETTPEFYFDVHYNKRLEVNAVAPFEIHGMAICWESSPVYYVNLPKDLLWSDKRRDDYSSLGTSGDKSTSPHEHWLEIVGKRWNRIGKMLGKRNVRKFTWNLKVQIQVLKSPAVSVKKFGIDLAGQNLGLELIDNSYSLLSPVHVKDGIDMCIVAWILWPDEERSSNPNLEKVIRRIILTSLGLIFSMCSVFLEQMEFLIITMLKIMAK